MFQTPPQKVTGNTVGAKVRSPKLLEKTFTMKECAEETPLSRKKETAPGTSKTQETDATASSQQHEQATKVGTDANKWESGSYDPTKTLSPYKRTPPPQPKPLKKTPLELMNRQIVTRRLSMENEKSPGINKQSSKGMERVAEARRCLEKVKSSLKQSGNTKKTLVLDITVAAERLYQLVKEDVNVKGKTRRTEEPATEEEQTPQIRKEEDRLSKSLEKIMLENNEKMKRMTETLEKHQKDQERLHKESNDRMEKLKETIVKHQELQEKQTYASVAGTYNERQTNRQQTLHSVVITAKDENETGEEVMNRIRKTVNAKESGISVEKIRKAKDRKVIVGCKTMEERDRFKEKLREAKELNVEEIRNKNPLVIFKDVLKYNTDEDILSALRTQNKKTISEPTDKESMEIVYKKHTRNPYTHHVVMRVSPAIWRQLVDAGIVAIDLQKVRVEDQSPLVQCSMCLGYGHGRRFCKESTEKCCHCGGPHVKADCADWLAGVAPTCTNCTHAKIEKADHNAFSGECAIRRRWDALARASVAYC